MTKVKHIILRKQANIIFWGILKSKLQSQRPLENITDEKIFEELIRGGKNGRTRRKQTDK